IDYGDEDDYGSNDNGVETDSLTQLSDSVKTTIDSVSRDSIFVNGVIDSIEASAAKRIEEKSTIDKATGIKKVTPINSTKPAAVVKEAARADIPRSMAQDSVLRQQAVIPEEATADSLINQ